MNNSESAVSFSLEGENLSPLETVEILSGPNPTASVIWLHGLGADGHDFEPLVPYLAWPGAPAIRYVFPHAPVRPVTLNGGMPMRAWYDILSLDGERGHDREGVDQSIRQVYGLLEREEERGIAADRIILAGFSQGGAIALQLGLRCPRRLAGLIGLSTYMLFAGELQDSLNEANRKTPVFLAHGTSDPMVLPAMGETARKQLVALGLPVEWHTYPMPHSVCPEEISDIADWLRIRLG
jgi:phospholipase/carboxylesterase